MPLINDSIMIHDAIDFITRTLNQYLKGQLQFEEDVAICNAVVDSDGKSPQQNKNKVVLSLVNIEKENDRPFRASNINIRDGNYSDVDTSHRYNMHVLVSSNFEDYTESLKCLNKALEFFQAHPLIDNSTNASLPSNIRKLDSEVMKINFREMYNLWSALGAVYLPSMIYRVRVLGSNLDERQDEVPPIV